MKSTLLLSALFAAIGASLFAQRPIEIAGFEDPPGASEWGSETDLELAAVRYDETPGEVSLLFVHTTLDLSVSGQKVAAGVLNIYPFLMPTRGWNASASELLALPNTTWRNATASLFVPPDRIAAHLQRFITAGRPTTGYGTRNSSTTATQSRLLAPVNWPSIAVTDERYALNSAHWVAAPWSGGSAFRTARLGRDAVIQAAHDYVQVNPNLPPLDREALNKLNELLDMELGFEINLQVAHITVPASQTDPMAVRFSRLAKIRRRSLLELEEDPWHSLMGAQRWVPSLLNSTRNITLGLRGELVFVPFPHAVGGLRAWFPTANGLADRLQLPNPVHNEVILRPDIALFACPADAIVGTAYFEYVANPGVPVVPLGHFEGGIVLWPFDLLPEQLPVAPPGQAPAQPPASEPQ